MKAHRGSAMRLLMARMIVKSVFVKDVPSIKGVALARFIHLVIAARGGELFV